MPTDRGGRWLGKGFLAQPTRRLGPSFLDRRAGDMSRPFKSRPFATTNPLITGITRDGAGSPLGFCQVQLFRTVDDSFRFEVQSDANGSYTVRPDCGGPFYIVAYRADAPDLAGTTVNTLQPQIGGALLG